MEAGEQDGMGEREEMAPLLPGIPAKAATSQGDESGWERPVGALEGLGSSVHRDRWGWLGWCGQVQGRLRGEVGKNRPLLACWG